MTESKLYSIVIPVYGTAESLIEIAERVRTVFGTLPGRDYELIFVNDASPNPETAPVLNRLFQTDQKIVIITFNKNFGQQAATLCGIQHASGDWIITMDDDLQHAPEDIPSMIEYEGHDAVVASFQQKKHSLFKNISSNLKGWFDYIILKKPKHLKLTSFRLINRRIVDGLRSCQTPYPFIPAMLFRITSDIINVDVEHYKRMEGNSQYTFWKMVSIFSNLLINNSYLLLRVLGIVGVSGFVASILFSVYLVVRYYFWGFGVSGWASLILAVVFLGGMILFGIGIIGEYLLRILANIEQTRMYYIRDVKRHE